MQTSALTPQQQRQASARHLGRQGYAISESVFAVGLFYVQPPEGASGPLPAYAVDAAGGTCNCPDFTGKNRCGTCKHIEFVTICSNYIKTMARKAAAARAAKPVRNRRHFSAKHLQALRRFSPTMAPVKRSAEIITISTRGRAILSSEEIARRIAQDF